MTTSQPILQEYPGQKQYEQFKTPLILNQSISGTGILSNFIGALKGLVGLTPLGQAPVVGNVTNSLLDNAKRDVTLWENKARPIDALTPAQRVTAPDAATLKFRQKANRDDELQEERVRRLYEYRRTGVMPK